MITNPVVTVVRNE